MSSLIYGKNKISNIVNISYKDGKVYTYTEDSSGVKCNEDKMKLWILTHQKYGDGIPLDGMNMYYKFLTLTDDLNEHMRHLRGYRVQFETKYNATENVLIRSGKTYFKNMHPKDVSVLSFDIETNGIALNDTSEIFMISNTYRKGDKVIRKLFSLDDYTVTANMLEAWVNWVNEMNPSIMLGHNIFSFDLPYIAHMAKMRNVKLNLGRDGSVLDFNQKPRKFRKDGSQFYDYYNATIFGREIIDTFFLSIKYNNDNRKEYESFGLKAIIKAEGLERTDRQHYDASQIRSLWYNPIERQKIKTYAEHDADDALALFDKMIPAYFYYNQSIPKSFQEIINSASGSQINSFLIRAYLQNNWGLPKASPPCEYQGAISYGNPGLYENVYKVDVKSMYPSIILEDELFDLTKDPKGFFLEMVRYFTDQRLQNKRLAASTKDQKYLDLSNSQKIMINSAYGFLGASGLNFNSPEIASHITKRGREILMTGIKWAENKKYTIVNVDTDSFSFVGNITNFQNDLDELNSKFSKNIEWENDGKYDKFLVVKAKNYVMVEGDNYKVKGSALKGTMKEKALQDFMNQIIRSLCEKKIDQVKNTYQSYAKQIIDINDIRPWCSKKTVTEAVLNPKRTNEARVLDAIGDKPVQEGDKIFVFFKSKKELCLAENFNGKYDIPTLHRKLYNTMEIFESVLNGLEYKNYSLKKHQDEIRTIAQ